MDITADARNHQLPQKNASFDERAQTAFYWVTNESDWLTPFELYMQRGSRKHTNLMRMDAEKSQEKGNEWCRICKWFS